MTFRVSMYFVAVCDSFDTARKLGTMFQSFVATMAEKSTGNQGKYWAPMGGNGKNNSCDVLSFFMFFMENKFK